MENLLTLEMLGWLLTVVVTVMLGKGAIGKVMGTPEMVGNFNYMKLSEYRVAVGVTEIIALLLLITPGVTLYGAVLIACTMSAAVALHLSLMGGAKVSAPLIVGVLALLAHILRTLH
jgi:hypothetical protein